MSKTQGGERNRECTPPFCLWLHYWHKCSFLFLVSALLPPSPPLFLLSACMKHFQGKCTNCLKFTQAHINRLRYSHGCCSEHSVKKNPHSSCISQTESTLVTHTFTNIQHSDMYCALFSIACFPLFFYQGVPVFFVIWLKTHSQINAAQPQEHTAVLDSDIPCTDTTLLLSCAA